MGAAQQGGVVVNVPGSLFDGVRGGQVHRRLLPANLWGTGAGAQQGPSAALCHANVEAFIVGSPLIRTISTSPS
jgi:hypothetical protein